MEYRVRDNPNLALDMISCVKEKVLNSKISEDLTFHDYLYSENGYFAQNPNVFAVVIVDGKLSSVYKYLDKDKNEPKVDLAGIAKEVNSLPFVFCNNDPEGNYLRRQKFLKTPTNSQN